MGLEKAPPKRLKGEKEKPNMGRGGRSRGIRPFQTGEWSSCWNYPHFASLLLQCFCRVGFKRKLKYLYKSRSLARRNPNSTWELVPRDLTGIIYIFFFFFVIVTMVFTIDNDL